MAAGAPPEKLALVEEAESVAKLLHVQSHSQHRGPTGDNMDLYYTPRRTPTAFF